MKIFSVYDSKALAFLPPFYAQATGSGIRMFEQAANEEGHQFHRHAGDFTLFELGEWDEIAGTFHLLESHTNLGLAITYINKVAPGSTQGADLSLAGGTS